MPYTRVSFRMTLSDLEWLGKIFNATNTRNWITGNWLSQFRFSTCNELRIVNEWMNGWMNCMNECSERMKYVVKMSDGDNRSRRRRDNEDVYERIRQDNNQIPTYSRVILPRDPPPSPSDLRDEYITIIGWECSADIFDILDDILLSSRRQSGRFTWRQCPSVRRFVCLSVCRLKRVLLLSAMGGRVGVPDVSCACEKLSLGKFTLTEGA